MRILQITPEAPGRFSGGKLGVRQTALSLIQNGHIVDYIGPQIDDEELSSLYNCIYILEPSHNVPLRIYDTLHMNTNSRYRAWLKLNLDYSCYDAIVMDFTKLNYVLKRIPKDRLIVRVHNVEADYSLKNYNYCKNIYNFIDKLFAGKREKQIVKHSKCLLVLTEKDKKRINELYGVSMEKMRILPVCVQEQPTKRECINDLETVRMIVNGTLWFGPNYEGIKWFLDHVYNRLEFPKHLIIAGANPNEELIEKIRYIPHVSLVNTPSSMEPYFLQSDIAIAPVFDGAGMKVKVAEALSFGLPVVGTTHAFEGYEITHGVNSFCADVAEEFINCIRQYCELSSENKNQLKKDSLYLFENHYSQICSNHIFQGVLSEINL